jgi:hypothetical protein
MGSERRVESEAPRVESACVNAASALRRRLVAIDTQRIWFCGGIQALLNFELSRILKYFCGEGVSFKTDIFL